MLSTSIKRRIGLLLASLLLAALPILPFSLAAQAASDPVFLPLMSDLEPPPTPTASPTATPTATPTASLSPTATATSTATATATPTATATATPTATATSTATPTATATASPTATVTATPTASPTKELTPGWSAYEVRVVELANQERTANGCAVMLAMNDKLHQAAYGHSADMVARDFFSHTNPDGEGPGERLAEVGYVWSGWGENIAAGYPSPEDVMAGWMGSEGHRANILNCNFTELGVGYVYAANDGGELQYRHYWTQVFGRPR